MLWSGTFQKRQSVTGGISPTKATTAQLDIEVTFATSPMMMVARIQPPAAIALVCRSCMISGTAAFAGALFKSEHVLL
jgi:hypothetical protein